MIGYIIVLWPDNFYAIPTTLKYSCGIVVKYVQGSRSNMNQSHSLSDFDRCTDALTPGNHEDPHPASSAPCVPLAGLTTQSPALSNEGYPA